LEEIASQREAPVPHKLSFSLGQSPNPTEEKERKGKGSSSPAKRNICRAPESEVRRRDQLEKGKKKKRTGALASTVAADGSGGTMGQWDYFTSEKKKTLLNLNTKRGNSLLGRERMASRIPHLLYREISRTKSPRRDRGRTEC